MFAIRNAATKLFVKHLGGADSNFDENVQSVEEAQHYPTYEYARNVAFWYLDYMKTWEVVPVHESVQ